MSYSGLRGAALVLGQEKVWSEPAFMYPIVSMRSLDTNIVSTMPTLSDIWVSFRTKSPFPARSVPVNQADKTSFGVVIKAMRVYGDALVSEPVRFSVIYIPPQHGVLRLEQNCDKTTRKLAFSFELQYRES